ncbi:MAG: LysR family transcriptional regulator [Spirulina sp. SIO3F2]|nr:LysR family transcriptional regulator [Spirulina sp. SIO3F2]
MRIEQLRAFLAVVETRNFGQAARACHITQSTISRQIQALESEVGLPLFHRSGQASLTAFGEQLLPRIKRICHEWDQSLQEATDMRDGKQPELCVAAIHSVCAHHLPPILRQFCRYYPDVQLRVTALGSDRALKVLRDNLVDVAIVMHNRFLTTSSEMVVDFLYDEPVEVLMAANHPLTQHSQIPWTELVKYPQVVFKDGYGMQRLVQEHFQQLGTPIQTAMELNTLDAFRGVVRQGELIALLPQTALLESRQDPTLAVRTLAPVERVLRTPDDWNLSRQVVCVTTQDRLQIPPIAHFRQLVRQFFTQSPHSMHSTVA